MFEQMEGEKVHMKLNNNRHGKMEYMTGLSFSLNMLLNVNDLVLVELQVDMVDNWQ